MGVTIACYSTLLRWWTAVWPLATTRPLLSHCCGGWEHVVVHIWWSVECFVDHGNTAASNEVVECEVRFRVYRGCRMVTRISVRYLLWWRRLCHQARFLIMCLHNTPVFKCYAAQAEVSFEEGTTKLGTTRRCIKWYYIILYIYDRESSFNHI